MNEKFIESIQTGYTFKGDSILLGTAMHEGECISTAKINVPLKTFNRHGLIAGATGSGKTKTLQKIAEALSEKGVPTLMMDVKGDLSGIAAEGVANDKINQRHEKIGQAWQPTAYPTELLSISNEPGAKLRATVIEFGPVLFSKILELNDTQSGVVSLVFKYADDNGLPLLDLKDFKKTLQYLTNEGKEEIEKEYGRISTASTSTIIRKIIEIEQQGAERFFGEKSFEVEDLLRVDERGMGYMNILRLADIQTTPKLFSTFMLSLLAEIYANFPEEGDLDQPKLVLFIDEAHLIFNEASKALLNQIESIIKLIRSKGVGIFFVTQTPVDIPSAILGQLGMKVQHAFRAFTANDRKDLKLIAQNYPISDYYEIEKLLTELGIGEALVTVLNEKGSPTPIAHTMLCAPQSRMDILSKEEIENLIAQSSLVKKYNQEIDRESAFEILNAKLNKNVVINDKEKTTKEPIITKKQEQNTSSAVPTMLSDALGSTAGKQVMRTIAREVTRGLLGVLGLSSGSKRGKKSSSWF
jgi:DNA helicase HerA-like ATPase